MGGREMGAGWAGERGGRGCWGGSGLGGRERGCWGRVGRSLATTHTRLGFTGEMQMDTSLQESLAPAHHCDSPPDCLDIKSTSYLFELGAACGGRWNCAGTRDGARFNTPPSSPPRSWELQGASLTGALLGANAAPAVADDSGSSGPPSPRAS